MNRNIRMIREACEAEGFRYKSHHATGNLLSVEISGSHYIFVNWTTPLNPQSIMQLCQDKDYFYTFYKDVIKMPATLSFLNPYSDKQYEVYLEEKTVCEIIETIEHNYAYPIILKKNRGSWGKNVFKAHSRIELEKGVLEIFNANSAGFDYVCLAQECIDIDKEYRVIFLDGNYQFAYSKIIDNARFSSNLSPLHWDGAKAEMIYNEELIDSIKAFCAPLFNKLTIPFCGLDIAVDKLGGFWLIEANASPGFEHIIEYGGQHEVIWLYRKMLKALAEHAD